MPSPWSFCVIGIESDCRSRLASLPEKLWEPPPHIPSVGLELPALDAPNLAILYCYQVSSLRCPNCSTHFLGLRQQ